MPASQQYSRLRSIVKAKELPELDDEFAQDVSEFDTLAEYKEDVKKKLTERKEADAHRTKEDEAIEKIIDDAKMDIPEANDRQSG